VITSFHTLQELPGPLAEICVALTEGQLLFHLAFDKWKQAAEPAKAAGVV
jgi:hypothetical protein